MAPLDVEICGPDEKWIKVNTVKPIDLPGSITDNKPDGSRELYIFQCSLDGLYSIIYRSKAGIDAEKGLGRMITTTGLDVVKELKKGDKPYEMSIKTDKSSETRRIRFVHV
ncbi:MAG: hypothetical protein NTY99_00195 [DPANN group archaeon]|nr:hypothetical protein [DPANN group archaeon]